MLTKKTNKITKILKYVLLEWTLIFLLLLNSLYSYFIHKFAVYFRLKPPCLLCSRLDHVFNSETANKNTFSSCTKFICHEHATEISKFSSLQEYDAPLVKWMKEIGLVENGEVKKCSSNPYFDFMANLITEKEFNGCFLDRDSDSGYELLDDVEEENEEEEEEVVLDAEKQPLLPQHLEFYVDHDDYRLIPVESEKNESLLLEFCKGVDLVFECDDEITGFSEVNGMNLPSIKEEDEEDEAVEVLQDENGVYSNCADNNVNLTEEVLNGCHSIIENGVSEVCTSSIQLPSTDEHDGEAEETSVEIEEEKVPETPKSVESLNLVEKLKSELESEKNALRALYLELEEERNASAIAANETLAMITRLQEEKATIQMEGLQYQRMMEEQSEYDQEALQMMNELMVKREKEKIELEKEVEVYRKTIFDFEEREKARILCKRMRSRNNSSSPASVSYGEESDGLSIDLNHQDTSQGDPGAVWAQVDNLDHQDTPTSDNQGVNLQDYSFLGGFEEERQSILEQLKVLEEKLFTLVEEEEEEEENGGENGHMWMMNGVGSMQKRLLPLFDEVEFLEDSPNTNGRILDSKLELEKKRLAIEEEVDHVYERLHALEADREFLKHCIGSLRKGDKGIDLLQEILQHLRDLKNVELQINF